MVRIFIHNYQFHPDARAADDNARDDDSIHHYPVVVGYQSLSKLLRVNRESRQAALEFYRVAIPCRFSTSDDEAETRRMELSTRRGTFYFNPEWDFLHLTPEPVAEETLLEFIHRLKTVHDPRGVGLLNVAFEGNDLVGVETVDPAKVEPGIKESFMKTLAQLRNVYFVNYTAAGRHCEGWRSGYCGEVFFNRSMPIMGRAPSFELFQRDPRAIGQDLRRVLTGLSKARVAEQMESLFASWGARPRDVQYRFLLAFKWQGPDSIYDRDSARRFVKKEDDYWNWCAVGGYAPGDRSRPFGNIKWPAIKIPEEDLQSVPRPVVGFWLFSTDFLTDGEPRNTHVTDLSNYWPQLAILSLP